jgi:hypothetical protein
MEMVFPFIVSPGFFGMMETGGMQRECTPSFTTGKRAGLRPGICTVPLIDSPEEIILHPAHLFVRDLSFFLSGSAGLLHLAGVWSRVSKRQGSWKGAGESVQVISDFLSFRCFISPGVLILCYFAGAAAIPAAAWFAAKRTAALPGKGRGISGADEPVLERAPGREGRGKFFSFLALLFVAMEILWRVAFEFLMGFLQMREALLELAKLR